VTKRKKIIEVCPTKELGRKMASSKKGIRKYVVKFEFLVECKDANDAEKK